MFIVIIAFSEHLQGAQGCRGVRDAVLALEVFAG